MMEEECAMEIAVLESIYVKREELWFDQDPDQQQSVRKGRFRTSVKPPPDFSISVRNIEVKGKAAQQRRVYPVSHLPPIDLRLVLPSCYPSKKPPFYALTCSWLTRRQLTRLCRHLDELWAKNQGTVILHTWFLFLEQEALDFLNLKSLRLRHEEPRPQTHPEKPLPANLPEKPQPTNLPNSKFEKKDSESDLTDKKDHLSLRLSARLHHEKPHPRAPTAGSSERENSGDMKIVSADDSSSSGGQGSDAYGVRYYSSDFYNYHCAEDPRNVDGSPISKSNSGGNQGGLNSTGFDGAEQENPDEFGSTGFQSSDFFECHCGDPDKRCPESQGGSVDCRTTQPRPASASALLHFILDFDQKKHQEAFDQSSVDCSVCFAKKRGLLCMRFEGCGHAFCRECVGEYFTQQIKEGKVKALNCLQPKCNSEALPNQVREVVSADLYRRYDQLLLQSTLDGMQDVVYCPRRSCQHPVIKEGDLGRCTHCFHSFCVLCTRQYHSGKPCGLSGKDLRAVGEQYQRGDTETRRYLEKRYGRRVVLHASNESSSLEYLSAHTTNCPQCKRDVNKSEGCNMVSCHCKAMFCFLCGEQVHFMDPYYHFNDPRSKCYHKLFDSYDPQEEGFFEVRTFDDEDFWEEWFEDEDEHNDEEEHDYVDDDGGGGDGGVLHISDH